MPHTIVLSKFNDSAQSQHWEDFDGVDLAMDGICQMYERQLKKENPNKRQITYDIQNLFEYIDKLPDLSCLVYVHLRSISIVNRHHCGARIQMKHYQSPFINHYLSLSLC